IENFGEARAGGQVFVPGAITPLRFDQVLDPVEEAAAGGIASRNQSQDGPCGLRRSAGCGGKSSVVVTGTAFTPPAVGILNRSQPLAGAKNVGLAIVFSGGAQTS